MLIKTQYYTIKTLCSSLILYNVSLKRKAAPDAAIRTQCNARRSYNNTNNTNFVCSSKMPTQSHCLMANAVKLVALTLLGIVFTGSMFRLFSCFKFSSFSFVLNPLLIQASPSSIEEAIGYLLLLHYFVKLSVVTTRSYTLT